MFYLCPKNESPQKQAMSKLINEYLKEIDFSFIMLSIGFAAKLMFLKCFLFLQ